MVTSWIVKCLVLLLLAAALASCGRSNSPAGLPLAAPASPAINLPQGLTSLPALAGLPLPGRTAAQLGPGWAAIPPQETVSSGNTSLGPGAALTLNAAGGMAYAIYGIAGFDGDNGPTSARVTLSSLTGQYYIGFSDYVAGTWRWAGPFVNTAEAEIPLPSHGGSSDYLSPRAFTSPGGICYFVVAIPTGGTLVITGTELGVQGGVLGPEWTTFDSLAGGANGCLIHWRASASCNDPDFMGYVLERAPLLFGGYAPVGGGVIKGSCFLDDTAVIDVTYRYRLAAVDASGNLSLWASTTGGATTGDLTPPVPVLKLPRGPLYSPAQVTLDLSESYDPEGVGITDYAFSFVIYPDAVTGPSDTCTVTLPPGCHVITAQVTTADARVSSTTAFLKVYPTWQDTPVVVAEPDPAATLSRLIVIRGALQPGTTRPVLFGAENATRSCTTYYQTAAGDFMAQRLPLFDPISGAGEPVINHQSVIFPIATGPAFQLAFFEAGTARWLRPGINVEGFSAIAAATAPGNKLSLFVAQNNGGLIDLMAFEVTSTSTAGVIVAPNIVALLAINVLYNTSSSCYDIVYSTNVSTEWVRWDPATSAITASAALSLGSSAAIDLEAQPVNGRPGVARYDSLTARWLYTELDATLTWTAAEIVDNTGVNATPGDLAYGDNGDAFMYFATIPGQSHLHERTAPATWAPRNTPAYAATAGQESVLMNLPGTDEFLGVDRTAGNHVIIGNLAPAPAETIVWDLPPYQGLLNNIQGAAGTVDTTPNGNELLHVMFNDATAWDCQHYTSTTGGASWVSHPVTSFRDIDLGATREGGVYATNNVALNHELHFWDPVADAFALYTIAPGTARYSFLSSGMANNDVVWFSYDDVNSITYTTGHFGVAPTVTSSICSSIPVWAGAGDAAGYSTIYSVLAHGADMNAASLRWDPAFDGGLNLISDAIAVETLEAYDVPAVRMKQVAACSYMSTHAGLGLGLPSMAIWTTYGPLLDAQRFDVNLATSNSTTVLPFRPEFGQTEPRRTVAAACGAGWTAIGLVSLLDGSESYFEWSNYGDWERLELPPALSAACNPELIVGRDGNWHIVYWDWATDRVMCLNSL